MGRQWGKRPVRRRPRARNLMIVDLWHGILLGIQLRHGILVVIQLQHRIIVIIRLRHGILLILRLQHGILLGNQLRHGVLGVIQLWHRIFVVIQLWHRILVVIRLWNGWGLRKVFLRDWRDRRQVIQPLGDTRATGPSRADLKKVIVILSAFSHTGLLLLLLNSVLWDWRDRWKACRRRQQASQAGSRCRTAPGHREVAAS